MDKPLLPALHTLAWQCRNLRPVAGHEKQYLTPVPAVAMGIEHKSWRQIGHHVLSDNRVVDFFATDNKLGASLHAAAETPSEPPYVVAENLSGYITGTSRSEQGFNIYTTGQTYRAEFDENMLLRLLTPVTPHEWPTVSTVINSETTIQTPVAGFKLLEEYNPQSTQLEPSDEKQLARELVDAYYRGSIQALEGGSFVGAVMTRYRLYDRVGNMVFESMPKLHVPTGRHAQGMNVTLNIAGGRVEKSTMGMAAYKLALRLYSSEVSSIARARIARLEVQVTPQLHAVNEQVTPFHRINRSEQCLTATVPGCHETEGSRALLCTGVKQMLLHADELFTTVMTVHEPFNGAFDAGDIAISRSTVTVKEEAEALKKAFSRNLAEVSPWLRRCRLPHAVWGRMAVSDGEMTIMGNLTVKLYEGHAPEYFINHGTGLDDIETQATVKLGNTRWVTSRGGGRNLSMASLSPLFVYPDSEATEAELQLSDSRSNLFGVTLPLTPCGRYAIYLQPDLQPITLEPRVGETMSTISSNNQPIRYPGNILTLQEEKMEGTATEAVEIHAIIPVTTPSTTAWESSRSRYYIMGSGGIFGLPLKGLKPLSPVRLSDRGIVRSDACVNVTENGASQRVCALAGGDLISIVGNKVTTLAAGIEGDMLAWIGKHNELLVINESTGAGSVARVLHGNGAGWSERDLPPASTVFSKDGVATLTSSVDNCIYDLNAEATEMRVNCRYFSELEQPVTHLVKGLPLLSEIVTDLTASHAEGEITVSGNHGRGVARTLTTLFFNGEINWPLVHHTLMPRYNHLFINLAASLSCDAHFSPSNAIYYGTETKTASH